jgi:hypothetical protein
MLYFQKMNNGELHNLYSSPNIIRMIKLRHIIQEGHVACMGESEMQKILTGNSEGNRRT